MAVDWTVAVFDPHMPGFVENPYPFYARLRREDPVHFVPAVGMWWVTRHEDAVTVLKDGRFGKEPMTAPQRPQLPPTLARVADLPPSMFSRDPPDHTRLRSLVNKAFTPRTIERLRPYIEEIASSLLDEVDLRGRMDLVADYAFPLPATVIGELLGVPHNDRDLFKAWSGRVILTLDATQPQEVREQGQIANLELADYFATLVEARRSAPEADLISELITAEEQGDRLNPGEILSMCALLLVAGHETTTSLIGTGTLTLLRHPEQLWTLRDQPALMSTAVEELLRYESPAQRMGRSSKEDVEFGGKRIRRGERVIAVIGAANRDPEVFTEPEVLDITRERNPHLAFGRWIHFCLGAALAVVEAEIAFTVLLKRFPRLALDDRGPEWSPNTAIRSLRSLPVRF